MTSPARARSAGVAWALLDWAASAFSTVLITLVVAYFERVVFVDRGWGVDAGVVWAWTLAAAMLLSAVVTPFLAAWADRHGTHVAALVAGVLLGAGGLALLGILPPTARLGVAGAVVIAAVGFDLAVVFTGSLLPRIASGPAADRLSAAGFALGYAGGAIALVVATAIVAAQDRLGLTMVGGLQASFVFTAAWWLLFSWPAAVTRFGPPPPPATGGSSFGELCGFVADLARGDAGGRGLLSVLGGSMLTLGAVQTAIAQFSSVALEEFRLESPELVRLVLLVQAVALPGALAVGWFSTRWGRTAAFVACLAGWCLVLLLAWTVQTKGQLHALAVLLALVLGGVQSVVRATVAGVSPAGRSGATFGLLHVGTKLAGFAASLLFGVVLAASGQPRAGLLVLLGFLVAGGWLAVRSRDHDSPRTSRIE
jgi:UMF1 family MFS transporter